MAISKINIYKIFFVFLIIVLPTTFMWENFLIPLDSPVEIYYNLFSAHINFIDIATLLFLLILLIKRDLSIPKENLLFLLAFLYGLGLLQHNQFSINIYFDDIIYFLRFFSYAVIGKHIANSSPKSIRLFFISFQLFLLFSILISLFAFFFYDYTQNEGRLNALGMGPNVAAELSLLSLILSLILIKNSYVRIFNIVNVSFCSLFIALSGSRRFFILQIFFLLVIIFSNKLSRKLSFNKIFFYSCLFITLFSLTLFTIYSNYSLISNFMHKNPDFIIFDRIIQMENQYFQNKSIDGRLNIVTYIVELHQEFSHGIGSSNWAIQSQLTGFGPGTGSHFHSLIIQYFFKYSYIGILFVLFLIYNIIRNFNLASPFSLIMVAVMLSQSIGYAFWNIKYSFFVITFYMIAVSKINSLPTAFYPRNQSIGN